MSILIDDGSRVLVQGITGREGQFHTERTIRYGTRVVGGVTPGRGGQSTLGVPVFDSVRQAVRETGADVSVAFVPAALAADAACEASEAGAEARGDHRRARPGSGYGAGESISGNAARCSWAPTARESSAPASARSGSCPATSTAPAASGW